MKWEIINEQKRKYADTTYYLKAKRVVKEGVLILEISWITNFMYDLQVNLFSKNTGLKSLFKKTSKNYIYGHLVQCYDRIEKYGHQIMRITDNDPMSKLKRLDELQGDSVLNWNIFDKLGIEIKTSLPQKEESI